MQTIIESLKSRNFPLTQEDELIYANARREFTALGCADPTDILFANILFLLNNKSVIDELLKHLEADVKQVWQEEQSNPDTTLKLHDNVQYVDQCGLSWPLPTAELAENHSHHLLSRVLLKMEQKHGINADNGPFSPIPTFVSFIPDYESKSILLDKKLWNEENKLSGFFYHGKMTHRIQFYLIMKAIELGMLDIGWRSITLVIELLVTTRFPNNSAWNMVVDTIQTNDNIYSGVQDHSIKEPLDAFPVQSARINGSEYTLPYLFGCDPYFLHSYLMSASRSKTPHLSECVTQMFAKSAFAIQRLEKAAGCMKVMKDYIININRSERYFPLAKLTEADLAMDQVLKRQAYTLGAAGYHYILPKDIREDRKKRGKNDEEVETWLQYRVHPKGPQEPAKTQGSWFTFFTGALPLVAAGAAVMALYKKM